MYLIIISRLAYIVEVQNILHVLRRIRTKISYIFNFPQLYCYKTTQPRQLTTF